MFPYSELQELHIELTEKCNARCPMCGRFDQAGNEIPYLTGSELSLGELTRFLPRELLTRLRIVRLCGNFGDPAVAKDALPICEWLRASAPGLGLHLHSNGSLREKEWWFDLGRLFRGRHDAVHFAIDGLEDTNHLYRRGTSFRRVMENAAAFIRGGGNAHWVFLVFAHNEHQRDEAKRRALQMGFTKFSVKATKRFLENRTLAIKPTFPIAAKPGDDQTYALAPPSDVTLRNRGLMRLQQIDDRSDRLKLLGETPIECRAIDRRGVYLSATGYLFPCCWVGANLPGGAEEERGTIRNRLAEHGGLEMLSLSHYSLEEIFNGAIFQEVIPSSWGRDDRRLTVCARTCGVELRMFDDQFLSS